MEINRVNFATFTGNTSYAYVGLNILREMCLQEVHPTLWPIASDIPPIEFAHIVKECSQRQMCYDEDAPSIRMSHQFDLKEHKGNGPRIGSTVFELNKFTPLELNHLRSVDAIIVPTEWARNILRENGVKKPTCVAPYGVDTTIFNATNFAYESFLPDVNVTTFINVSKKEIRKGHLELIQAFNSAFSPTDNVKLILVWYNRFYSQADNDEWDKIALTSQMGLAGKVEIAPNFLPSQSDIAKLYAGADCGVFPSKAEGYGLGPLEMMAMGKPVIVTNYSGHTQYCDRGNSLQINPSQMESAFDGKWFSGDVGEWMRLGPDEIDQMVEHMRTIHTKKQNGESLYNSGGVITSKELTWANTCDIIVKFVGDL